MRAIYDYKVTKHIWIHNKIVKDKVLQLCEEDKKVLDCLLSNDTSKIYKILNNVILDIIKNDNENRIVETEEVRTTKHSVQNTLTRSEIECWKKQILDDIYPCSIKYDDIKIGTYLKHAPSKEEFRVIGKNLDMIWLLSKDEENASIGIPVTISKEQIEKEFVCIK